MVRQSPQGWVRYRGPFLAFLRFGLAGLPGFILALALNFFLVKTWNWPKPAAYGLVVWMQMTSGFLMCRYLVFAEGREVPFARAYVQFAGSMGLIRAADWTVYTAAVEWMHVPFLAAQAACTGIFILIKFASARAIFRRKPA